MKWLKCLILAAAVPATVTAVDAGIYHMRQYYSGWHSYQPGNYYYRHYYYKPTEHYSGYRHHYVMYYPKAHPKYYYYYNPYKKQYWGRCPVESNGEEQYSMLAEKDRKGDINQIPESAFPKPTSLPALPEATDGEKLDLPPDDLPPDTNGLPVPTT